MGVNETHSCQTVRPVGQCCPRVECTSLFPDQDTTTTLSPSTTSTAASGLVHTGVKGQKHQDQINNELDFSDRFVPHQQQQQRPTLYFDPVRGYIQASDVSSPSPVFVPSSSSPATAGSSSTSAPVSSTTSSESLLYTDTPSGAVDDVNEVNTEAAAEVTTTENLLYAPGSSTERPLSTDAIEEDEETLHSRLSDSHPVVVSHHHNTDDNGLSVLMERENQTTIFHTSPATYFQDSALIVTSSPPSVESREEGSDESAAVSDEQSQSNQAFLDTIKGGCIINGTIYAEGSAVISSSFCEYCVSIDCDA